MLALSSTSFLLRLTKPKQNFQPSATGDSSWGVGDGRRRRRRLPVLSCVAELLQNCNLPPPIKLFSPPPPIGEDNMRHKIHQSLLRAVQLSQTRARQAEKRAPATNIGTEQTIALLLEDSLRMHTAMRWSRLLETQISLLKAEEDEDAVCCEMTCCQALSLCLGIAGAGFMLASHIF